MVHITIEYMIMIPVLILQILIFPYATTIIMGVWDDSRRTVEVQETVGNLGSSIQQLYYTVNHASISATSIVVKLETPSLIEGYAYTIRLGNSTNSNTSLKIMNVTINLVGTSVALSTLVTLGENAAWQENSTFRSDEISFIKATKTSSYIWLSLNGGQY